MMPSKIPPHKPAFWVLDTPLVLASGSTTRLHMLKQCGLPVEAIPASIDERAIENAQTVKPVTPASTAIALARAKALDVSARYTGRMVLGADQTLICDGITYHKPVDMAAAAIQLEGLSGREHRLCSGFALARDGQIVAQGASSAIMRMRRFGAAFIATYLSAAGENILGSVGGYQIEGLGSQLFEAIEGDHFTILGLPVLPVLAALREHGALAG
jgi:septum formation protein